VIFVGMAHHKNGKQGGHDLIKSQLKKAMRMKKTGLKLCGDRGMRVCQKGSVPYMSERKMDLSSPLSRITKLLIMNLSSK
jgi:hypothetical protein